MIKKIIKAVNVVFGNFVRVQSRLSFDEARKYGVSVINIEPDMTDTNLYRNADFTADDDEMARLTAKDVAETVLFAVNQREGMVVSDITVKPQFHRIKKKR